MKNTVESLYKGRGGYHYSFCWKFSDDGCIKCNYLKGENGNNTSCRLNHYLHSNNKNDYMLFFTDEDKVLVFDYGGFTSRTGLWNPRDDLFSKNKRLRYHGDVN